MKRFAYLLTMIALAISPSGCVDAGGEPELPDAAPAETLRASFPEQAAEVLEDEEVFVATEEGLSSTRRVRPERGAAATWSCPGTRAA